MIDLTAPYCDEPECKWCSMRKLISQAIDLEGGNKDTALFLMIYTTANFAVGQNASLMEFATMTAQAYRDGLLAFAAIRAEQEGNPSPPDIMATHPGSASTRKN